MEEDEIGVTVETEVLLSGHHGSVTCDVFFGCL